MIYWTVVSTGISNPPLNKYISIEILNNIGKFFTIWTIWDCLGPFGTIWDHFGPFGQFSPILTIFGNFDHFGPF